jgi:hypothetical protein
MHIIYSRPLSHKFELLLKPHFQKYPQFLGSKTLFEPNVLKWVIKETH